MKPLLAAALAAALLSPSPSAAQGQPMTLDEALGIARERAARVIAAAGQVEEARARLLPAARRLRESPVLEVTGGPRRGEETTTDYEVTVAQAFEPAARRRARLAGAEAAVAAAEAELADTRRLYLGEVAAAFVRALAAGERLRLAAEAAGLDEDLLATAERRFEMGATTALENNRARTAAARSRAEQSAALGARAAALGELRARLGIAPGEPGRAIEPAGRLRDLPAHDLDALLARDGERPDLRALAAGVEAAEAEVRLGEALARPGFGLTAGWGREERADIALVGVAVALPFARQGQEERLVGEARARSLRSQLAATRRAAEAEVRAAHELYVRQVAAVEELERTALPAVEDNQGLARRSFEVGEIDLGELLLIRREILETRLFHLDLMLAARLAAIELDTRAGGAR